MSMLDAFFNKGFKGVKCKTLLKLTIPRIKLLRNRREIQLKQMRRDIAKLLETGQEATARIRVEHIIREENMMAAQEILELFCELIVVRLPIIETQRECPLDLKEAISSICFAAPRCADLTELLQVQMLFAAKYGKEFVAAATELMPDCGVNRQIIELLSIRAPSVEAKMKLLKEIAEEHELDWDPASSETELLKPHEDLLNGPSHLISDSISPLPEEKHDESLSSAPLEDFHEEPGTDADAGFDLDLPEVPKVSVRPSPNTGSAPEIAPPSTASSLANFRFDHEITNSTSQNQLQPSPDTDLAPKVIPSLSANPPDLGLEHEITKSTSNEVMRHNLEPVVTDPKPSVASAPAPLSASAGAMENKQFIPFVSSPPSSSAAISPRQNEKAPPFPGSVPPLQTTVSGANIDLQDVLIAAQAAADSAERAAAAARSAASLAQVRITDLVAKMNCGAFEKNQQEIHTDSSNQTDVPPIFSEQHSFGHTSDYGGSDMQSPSFHDSPKLEPDAAVYVDRQSAHQPQRSTSLEDDPYFSYPNLFSRQNSGIQSSTNDSRFTHQ